MEAFQKQMKESELFLERIQATSGVDLAKLSYSRFSENNNYDVYEPVRFSWDDAKALDQIDVDGGVSGGSTDKKRNKKKVKSKNNDTPTLCIFHGWLVVFEALVLRRHPVNLQD